MHKPRPSRSHRSHSPFAVPIGSLIIAPLLGAALAMGACGGGSPGTGQARVTGQTSFDSAPPYGTNTTGGDTLTAGASAGGGSSGGGPAAPTSNAGTDTAATTPARTVQETDLYRLEGNRLYYLNSYRGLMVFDVTNVDQPTLLGRSPIFGTPVEMFVSNGIATVVVADWYGALDDGTPFHGSIVRGLDATDPAHIAVLGDAKLGGWVQDTRVVGGNVLYAVSEDYGWVYGAATSGGAVAGAVSSPTTTSASVIVSSVSFANGQIRPIASRSYPGYGGVFNVTPNAIMLAHPVDALQPDLPPPARTALQYLDISDPGGSIVERGSVVVDGSIQGWGADNGRWNLDFADGKTAHVIGCVGVYGCGSGYVLATADFSNPDQPSIASALSIASTGWSATARFDAGRMYLSPSDAYYSSNTATTPIEIFDLSNPAAPTLAGQTQIPGTVWIMIPSGNQLFALGQDSSDYGSSQVSLKYIDVTHASAPTLVGTSTFGDGWAWTPAAQTFKAFTQDPAQGLVVLPFSGWSTTAQQYNNGVQLIEFTPPNADGAGGALVTAGAAQTKGWVERGIFANGRILSLSDTALSVVDYSDPLGPKVTAQLTLARNVIAAQPSGSTIAEISSDWWGNDVSQSEVRVLPIADAAESGDRSQAPSLSVDGVGPQVFTNGSFTYIVTDVEVPYPCPSSNGPQTSACSVWQEQVEVVDLSNGGAAKRGVVRLPIDPRSGYLGWGWGGFYAYDWYGGGEVTQVGGDALAFRRWHPSYGAAGQYVDASSDLFVVDLSNPDAPSVSSLVVTSDTNGWWGNMKVIGDVLYTTHYVWPYGYAQNGQNTTVRYYLDAIDLTDRKNPKIQQSINVPGILVGGSATDPSILYTIDYRWGSSTNAPVNELDVIKLAGGFAHLQSSTALDGWVGNVFVQGTTAYTSTQPYVYDPTQPGIELHQIDLTDPARPLDRVAPGPTGGWGWLVGVEGDRMLVTSGWGPYYAPPGLDIYRLTDGAPPAYDRFVRTLGWGIGSAVRQDNQLFLTSGYWGVQTVDLQ
jgi:hypothetical protein